jgi:hypothetical protein
VWGWKEPRTTLFAACWLALFPEARILHIVRNPLAVAASMQKRELEFQGRGDAPSGRVHDFNYCVELAMIYVEIGEALAGQAEHYHRVRFEDVQADPASELKAVARFCDLRYTDRQLRRAVATIRPNRPEVSQQINDKRGLLTQYPLAAKLGYVADASSTSGGGFLQPEIQSGGTPPHSKTQA